MKCMAQKFFNDLEALEIGIKIEKQGERFYRIASEQIEDHTVKEMLLELAREEEDHAATFHQLYQQALTQKGDFDDTYLFEPEVSAYLRAMVESAIFPSHQDQDEVIESIRNVGDVLRMGIQAEKDSILFYTEMVIYSKLPEAKDAFRKLIKEEKKHLIDLQEKMKNSQQV